MCERLSSSRCAVTMMAGRVAISVEAEVEAEAEAEAEVEVEVEVGRVAGVGEAGAAACPAATLAKATAAMPPAARCNNVLIECAPKN
jgi:hypothetical protein